MVGKLIVEIDLVYFKVKHCWAIVARHLQKGELFSIPFMNYKQELTARVLRFWCGRCSELFYSLWLEASPFLPFLMLILQLQLTTAGSCNNNIYGTHIFSYLICFTTWNLISGDNYPISFVMFLCTKIRRVKQLPIHYTTTWCINS